MLRITSAAVPSSNSAPFLEYVQDYEIAEYECAPGLLSVWLVQRPQVGYIEFLTLSLWQSEQTLNSFVEGQTREYRGTAEYGAVRMDSRVYELALLREGKRH